ncbi:2-oxo-4-hydroxy-4-carboxy-5-ureidoimidazoline decarboxylase [Pseudorhodoferax sp. LjRoot39]|uniref:2-oxo-4-hydroxy-4-carboxy-5-ureidoimidazoline decarboxylase n=1 Tax=Pseudorhodoferax sp. LjRoot39 TaxID=3342328 RepID=UPI003ECC7E3F
MAALPTLAQLNAVDTTAFLAHLGEVFEHAPWVAAAVALQRPFASTDALHRAMLAAVAARPEEARVALFNGHPELAGAAARLGQMTSDSVREQGGLALGALGAEDGARWDALNTAYRVRFGFPFILCIKRHTRATALAAFAARLANDRATELASTLAEIGRITRLRLAERIADHGLDGLHGSVVVQVLDSQHGRSAEGLRLALHDADGAPLAEAVEEGRGLTLLAGAPLRMGRYELRLHLGDYHRQRGAPDALLDVVPVAFAIDAPEAAYRFTLSVAPWAYSLVCVREG